MTHLTIGILAHVDAGKTTLSEALLYRAGAVRKLGRVDHRDAFLDTDAQERERGITIFSKQARFAVGDVDFTLLDTPGHVDFSAEAERTLSVLDCAVLVVSGTDGVQSHTETLWRLLARYKVPTVVFVNKMDLPGADKAAVMASLRKLGDGFVDVSSEVSREIIEENAAACDERLMMYWFDYGVLPDDWISRAVGRRTVFPVWFGAALRLQGVDEFLQGLCAFAPKPVRGEAFGARVFKIGQDANGARLSYLKLTGGSLRAKTVLSGRAADGTPWKEKADALRLYSGAKFTPVEQADAGQVVTVTGLTKTYPGQGLGTEEDAQAPMLAPVLAYSVLPPDDSTPWDPGKVLTALRTLEQEDPQLRVEWDEQLAEVKVQLMGEVQLEVLRRRLADRFGLAVGFGPGGILYKESITATVEGIGHYEPLRHYAEVHLLLAPGEPGSGLTFAADCREEVLDKNWQRLVLTHLAEKTHKGVLTGAPITDMVITLKSGRAHLKHTEGGDFREATYRAVRQGLETARAQGGVVLLEPYYAFALEVPTDALGRAMTDMERRGAEFDAPAQNGDTALLTGTAPVAALAGYHTELAAYTKGRGRLGLSPAQPHYRPCHNAAEVIEAAGYESEHDLANPAGSVFCSHGAGIAVHWREVPDHAHLESCLAPPRPAEEEAPARVSRSRGGSYGGSLAEDKELMAIFERTYGPIKRDPLTAVRPTARLPKPAQPKFVAETEYLLVDGYNIIHAWKDLAEIAASGNLEGARRRLMDMLCNYRGYRPCELILVFDAYRVKGNPGTVEQYHNISVVYTKEAETADMYIEKVTRRLAKEEKGRRVRVATSDGLEQIIILGAGALRVSARSFREEVDIAEKEMRRYLADIDPGGMRLPVDD